MNWKDYSWLKDKHAFLSPSSHYWLNYDEDKLVSAYSNRQRVVLGTRYHAIASELIQLAIRLPDNGASLNSFVNDAIGFRMESEKTLFYSTNCYGTADAISYTNGILRIHDLKTGVTPASMDQLLIYAALFCLDYSEEPTEIQLRIYQNGETVQFSPSYQDVLDVMVRIMEADKILSRIEADVIF